MRHGTLHATATAVVAALATAATTFGQMAPVDPYQVRTTRAAEIRSGWGSDAWYSVGRVPAGTTLTVDARDEDWLQVSYPDGLGFGVLLRLRDIEIDEDADVARVIRPARAIHRNRQSPVEGSWLKMTGEPFPPGTEFRMIEIFESEGEPFFALVEAPDRARGYIVASAVERIEPEAPAEPSAGETDEPAGGPEQDETAETPAPEATQTDAEPAGEQPREGENDANQPDDPDAAEGDALSSDEPEDQPVERGAATADQLAQAYAAVIAEPVESAEFAPLIEEFERAIEAEDSERVRARLQAQKQLLEIRRDLQQDLRAVASAAERAAQERRAVERLVVDWQSRPAYTTVGRLMASALYDGRRLPLMYRLQSLDGPGGRTIAYILPDDDLDLNAKVGAVVGVLGETRRDRTIRVRLIDPERVDVLEPGG